MASMTAEYQVMYYDKLVGRFKMDVSKRPDNWDTMAQKASALGMRTSDYIRFDVARSSLQKSIRRGHADEAVYWAVTMLKTPKQGVSNLWNRLLVMSVEDVGPADVNVVSMVNYLYNLDRNNMYNVSQAAYLLAASTKSRFTDLCYHYYSNIPINTDSLSIVNKVIETLYKPYSYNTLFQMIHSVCQLRVKQLEESKAAKQEKAKINTNLPQGAKKVKARSVKNWLNHLVKQIVEMDNGLNQDYVEQIYDLRYNLGGGYVLAVIQLILCIHKRYDMFTICGLTVDDRVKWIADQVASGLVKFDVADYALDKHTSQGKGKMGRGIIHFYNEGSYLENRGGEWNEVEDNLLRMLINSVQT